MACILKIICEVPSISRNKTWRFPKYSIISRFICQ